MKGFIKDLVIALATGLVLGMAVSVSAHAQSNPAAERAVIRLNILKQAGTAYCQSLMGLQAGSWYKEINRECQAAIDNTVEVVANTLSGNNGAREVYAEQAEINANVFCGRITGKVGANISQKCFLSTQALSNELKSALEKDTNRFPAYRDIATREGAVFAESHVRDAVIFPWASPTAYNAYVSAFHELTQDLIQL